MSKSKGLDVQSVGVHAIDGSRICPEVAQRILAEPGGTEYVERFTSRSLHSVDVSQFELILTATGSIRSDLLREQPELRNRMFTLVESQVLTVQALSAEEAALLVDRGPSSIMLQRRGSQPTHVPQPGLMGRKNLAPLDVVDLHGSRSRRKHRTAIDTALQLGSGIGEVLSQWRAVTA